MAREEHEHKKEEKEEGKEFRSHAYAERYGSAATSTGWQEWVNGVLGLWLIVVPLIGLGASMTTLVITGILVAIVGFWGAAMRQSLWQQWLNAILGLWVIAIPFLAITGAALTWTLVVTGVVIAVLGFWAAGQERM